MNAFNKIAELALARANKATGKPEELHIQVIEAENGTRFMTLCTFWQAGNGAFCPPSREVPRLTIKRGEAAQVIELLQLLLGTNPGGPVAQAVDRVRAGYAPRQRDMFDRESESTQ